MKIFSDFLKIALKVRWRAIIQITPNSEKVEKKVKKLAIEAETRRETPEEIQPT